LVITAIAPAALDREQAKIVAGFGSTTRANTRLLELSRAGLLRRCFLGTTAGGTKALYILSPKGAQAVGVPFRGPHRRKDETLIADFFIEHQLCINEIYCSLKFRPIPSPGVTFKRWRSFQEPVTPSIRMIPDGYVELETPSSPLAAFLEIDLGNESLKVWKEKTSNYLQLAVLGECERRFGQSRFRVLVIAHSERSHEHRCAARWVSWSTPRVPISEPPLYGTWPLVVTSIFASPSSGLTIRDATRWELLIRSLSAFAETARKWHDFSSISSYPEQRHILNRRFL
jgi:hypothetical protein